MGMLTNDVDGRHLGLGLAAQVELSACCLRALRGKDVLDEHGHVFGHEVLALLPVGRRGQSAYLVELIHDLLGGGVLPEPSLDVLHHQLAQLAVLIVALQLVLPLLGLQLLLEDGLLHSALRKVHQEAHDDTDQQQDTRLWIHIFGTNLCFFKKKKKHLVRKSLQ